MGTVLLSGIDEEAIERLKYWATSQELSPGQYVARLVDLHTTLRRHVETHAEATQVADLLRRSGLR